MTTRAEQIATVGVLPYKIRNNSLTIATVDVSGNMRLMLGNIVLTLEETTGLKQWIIDNFETQV